MAQVNRDSQVDRKPDTVLLTRGNSTDLGNHLTDLTSTANGAREDDDRTHLASPREVLADFQATNTSSGTLVYAGDQDFSDHYFQMRLDGAGNVVCSFKIAGAVTTVFSKALPNVGVVARHYSVQWCTRPNTFLTTGAGDAFRSELTIIDHGTANSYALHRATHVAIAPTIGGTAVYSQGMRWDGAEQDIFSGTLNDTRIGKRFHSTAEAAQDWGVVAYTPANDGQSHVPPPPLPNNVGTEDQFAGPAMLYAIMAARKNAMRLLSPIFSQCFTTPWEVEDNPHDTAGVHDGLILVTDTNFYAHLGLTMKRPCPEIFNDLWVRISGQLWRASAGAPDQMDVRIYSANYRPGAPVQNPKISSLTLTWTVDDTSAGPPTWKSGRLRCNRTPDGFSYLWFAFRINNGTASADTRFKLWARSGEPIVVPLANDEDIPDWELPP